MTITLVVQCNSHGTVVIAVSASDRDIHIEGRIIHRTLEKVIINSIAVLEHID